MTLIIILVIVVLLALWIAGSYNRLITLVNKVAEAWSDIDVQLTRRYDLIPNLIETVKGYATHEREAFENVTKARAASLGATSPQAKGAAEGMLASALKSVFAIAEAYPELKANTNFQSLQEELAQTENTIQQARRYYNGNVRDLNTTIQSFPGNIIANMFKFTIKEFFQLDNEAAKEPVAVKF